MLYRFKFQQKFYLKYLNYYIIIYYEHNIIWLFRYQTYQFSCKAFGKYFMPLKSQRYRIHWTLSL